MDLIGKLEHMAQADQNPLTESKQAKKRKRDNAQRRPPPKDQDLAAGGTRLAPMQQMATAGSCLSSTSNLGHTSTVGFLHNVDSRFRHPSHQSNFWALPQQSTPLPHLGHMTQTSAAAVVPIVSAEHGSRYWELIRVLADLRETSTLHKKYLFDLLMIPFIAKSKLHPDDLPAVFLEALTIRGASQTNIEIIRRTYREAYDLMLLHDMQDRADRQGRLGTFLDDVGSTIGHMAHSAPPVGLKASPADPKTAFERYLAGGQLIPSGWQAAFPKWQRLAMMQLYYSSSISATAPAFPPGRDQVTQTINYTIQIERYVFLNALTGQAYCGYFRTGKFQLNAQLQQSQKPVKACTLGTIIQTANTTDGAELHQDRVLKSSNVEEVIVKVEGTHVADKQDIVKWIESGSMA